MNTKTNNMTNFATTLGLAFAPAIAFASQTAEGSGIGGYVLGGVLLAGAVITGILALRTSQNIIVEGNSQITIRGGTLQFNSVQGLFLNNATALQTAPNVDTITADSVSLTNIKLTIRGASVTFRGGNGVSSDSLFSKSYQRMSVIDLDSVDFEIFAQSATIITQCSIQNVTISGNRAVNTGNLVLTGNNATIQISSPSSITAGNVKIQSNLFIENVQIQNPSISINPAGTNVTATGYPINIPISANGNLDITIDN